MCFFAPSNEPIVWKEAGVQGALRFLRRAREFAAEAAPAVKTVPDTPGATHLTGASPSPGAPLVDGGATVVEAVRAAKVAARGIDAWLGGLP